MNTENTSSPQSGKKMYNREELFQICGEWSAFLMEILNYKSLSHIDLSEIFDEWFNKNQQACCTKNVSSLLQEGDAGEEIKVLKEALQEKTKQIELTAIAFAEWIILNGIEPSLTNGKWIDFRTVPSSRITSEELYQLFITKQ